MQQALLTPVPLPSCVGQEESSQGTEGVRTGSPRGEQGLADPCGRVVSPQEWWCHCMPWMPAGVVVPWPSKGPWAGLGDRPG